MEYIMIWKDIDGYDGNYQVSDHGIVRSRIKPTLNGSVVCDSYHIMQESYTYERHPKVSLVDLSKPVKNGRNSHYKKEFYIARIVLSTFVCKPHSDDLIAIHLDGKYDNVALKNLRWGTRKDLINIMRKNNAIAKGELLPQATICDQEALEIKHLLCNTPYTIQDICDIYGVGRSVVGSIYRDEDWRHIPWPGKIIKKIKKSCACCGEDFITKRFATYGRPVKYCSSTCRSRFNYLKNSNQKYEDVYK